MIAAVVVVASVAAGPAAGPGPALTDALRMASAIQWNAAVEWNTALEARPAVPPHPSPPAGPAPPSGSRWDRIAECESGGRWDTNTGNGYFGGLQMTAAFWRAHGGLAYAARPDLAGRTDQITVAEAAGSFAPWPVCGR